MVLTSCVPEILEVTPGVVYSRENNELDISTSRKELLGDDHSVRRPPKRSRVLKFCCADGFAFPSAKFWKNVEERDDNSSSLPSTNSRGSSPGSWKKFKEWIKNPLNIALLLWTTTVVVSLGILFTVMTGMLDGVLKKESQREGLVEACNQIATALFTVMCLYHHPKRIYHLVLLFRWKPKGISILREIYSKNGAIKPNERFHMTVVLVLLHVSHIAQYAVYGLNVGYKRSERPKILQSACIFVAVTSGVISSTYATKSPLGRYVESEMDEEAQNASTRQRLRLRNVNKIIELTPKWRGGLLNICDDIVVASRSLFCSCCLFGWNMERLGFGNMYVHIATFLLYCIAPFVIFSSASTHIDNVIVKKALSGTGLVLSFCGILYGGFWRIQMRKRYNLPGKNWFCGEPAVADCAQWTCFCCCCSLAQEVRTADYYEVLEVESCNDNGQSTALPPQPREDWVRCNPTSPPWNQPELGNGNACAGPSKHLNSERVGVVTKAPIPSTVRR